VDFLGVIADHYNAFLVGAAMTAAVSAVSIALGMILGLWLAFGLISRNGRSGGPPRSIAAPGGGRPSWCSS